MNGKHHDGFLERDPDKTEKITHLDVASLIKENEQNKWKVKDLENELEDLKR
jgi:hypothetical protein